MTVITRASAAPEIMALDEAIVAHCEWCPECQPETGKGLCDVALVLVRFTGREWGRIEVAVV